jgi:N-acetylglucosaminyldiphosphoundecaprenol N-acetyl-beta-D-mannosaminyltransferase
MAGQINILNTFIHNLSMEETLSLVNDTIKNKESIHHVVVNAGKIVQMQKDNQLRESCQQ